MQIKNISDDGSMAYCEHKGVFRDVSLMLVEDVKVGDFVMVHVGFAINKVQPAQAQAAWKTADDMIEVSETDMMTQ